MEEQAGGGFSQGWGVSVRGVYFKPKMAATFFFHTFKSKRIHIFHIGLRL